jgi:hypothetical protein
MRAKAQAAPSVQQAEIGVIADTTQFALAIGDLRAHHRE